MNELNARIARVRTDLAEIQQQLNWAAIEEPGSAADAGIDLEAVRQFKSCIDDMRHFLWSYLEGITLRSGQDKDFALQTFRMQRATEILRSLREQMGELTTELPQARSLFAEINQLSTLQLDRRAPAETALEVAL